MNAEPLIQWPEPLFEYLGFLCAFLAAGAIGFRLAVLPRLLGGADGYARDFGRAAARRAALLGLLGTAGTTILAVKSLVEAAARRNLPLGAALAEPRNGLLFALLALAFLGFALAAGGRGMGWALAAIAVLIRPLRALFFGEPARIVNPVHELAAGLWIGTLLVMVVVGISAALRGRLSPTERGEVVTRMVHGFSPLAQLSVGLLLTFGVITAWRHLKRLDALWTTPYGTVLIVKLVLVAGVLALGAWNWRRQKPRLGTEAAAANLKRSALAELLLAAVVLAVTSVLVGVPSPR